MAEDNMSKLSLSSFLSIENEELQDERKYSCDECDLIPKITDLDIPNERIVIECKTHGKKEFSLKDFLIKSQKFINFNLKCDICKKKEFNKNDEIKFCNDCKNIICSSCISTHDKKYKEHQIKINIDDKDKNIKCQEHSGKNFVYYCQNCSESLCEECKNEHKNHNTPKFNELFPGDFKIEDMKKKNKEYRGIINHYENLIKINNLIINCYENYSQNYNSTLNIINLYKNNIKNESIKDEESNKNYEKYFTRLYKIDFTIGIDRLREIYINNKKFDNYDITLLSSMKLSNLQVLNLDENIISDIAPLEDADFPSLKILSLNNNQITDISVLDSVNFDNLEALLLGNNKIENIDSLKETNFYELRLLNLENNKISDIGALLSEELEFLILEELYLNGNNLTEEQKKNLEVKFSRKEEGKTETKIVY